MNPLQAYKFCPRCAGELVHQHTNLLQCQKCKNPLYINATPAVGFILENNEGKIMLAKRAFDPFKGTWDIPGGFMEPHETAQENAIREAKEELNVTIQTGIITGTYPLIYPYKGIDIPVLVVAICAKITEGKTEALDDVSEIQYFSKEDLDKINIEVNAIKQLCLDYFTLREKVALKELFK